MAEQPTSRLMVLLFTDIVGSVDLKTRLGAKVATSLIARHDELFRGVVERIPGAELLKDTGDGFLASFATASDAVNASLRFQWLLHHEPWDPEPVRVRMGLNIGQVSELEVEPSGKPKLSGLAVDLAARIMDLARPSQLLMTRTAFDDARQYVREHPEVDGADAVPELRWMAHGLYLFKGAEEPLLVCEVGAEGLAPLEPPPDSEKALRSVAAQDEETLGWRPAAGLPVPGRKGWILDRKLGEGGFGEVWLAQHERTLTRRVFKFCFDADRVRSLKRELTLFRLLREALGDRKDIARLYEVQLEEPPYFLESEFTEHGSMLDWAAKRGGIADVPFETRIELVTRICRAVAAAHSVGVLHKDIKPANVLVYDDEDGRPRPRLSDFGIATVSNERLEGSPITVVGFTDDLSGDMTTTQMYAPPELLAGRPFTALGDVYALGVLLYQMVVADLARPLAQGWERTVADPLLRDDIRVCVEGNEQQRLGSAQGLAKRLESLPERRRIERRRRIVRAAAFGSGVLAVLFAASSLLFLHEGKLRRDAEFARDSAREINTFLNDMLAEANPFRTSGGDDVTIIDFLVAASEAIPERFEDRPDLQAEARTTIGSGYKHLGRYDEATGHLDAALAWCRENVEPPDDLLARALHERAGVHYWRDELDDAEAMFSEALAMRRALHDAPHPAIAETLHQLGTCHYKLGELAGNEGDEDARETRLALADRHLAEALAMRQRLDDAEGSVNTEMVLAMTLYGREKYADAETAYRSVLDSMVAIRGPEDAAVATITHNLARCLQQDGRLDAAEPLFVEAIRVKRIKLPADHPSLSMSLFGLAELHKDREAAAEAESLAREALDIRRASAHPTLPLSLIQLAEILTALQQLDEAETTLDECGRLLDGRDDDPRREDYLEARVALYEAWDRPDDAAVFRGQLERSDRD